MRQISDSLFDIAHNIKLSKTVQYIIDKHKNIEKEKIKFAGIRRIVGPGERSGASGRPPGASCFVSPVDGKLLGTEPGSIGCVLVWSVLLSHVYHGPNFLTRRGIVPLVPKVKCVKNLLYKIGLIWLAY